MNKHFLSITALLFLLISFPASAQVQNIANRQFEAENWLDASLNLKQDGVLIYGWQDRTTFVMKVLDTALEDYAKWQISTSKATTLADIDYYEEDRLILILMKDGKKSYTFTTYDLETKKKKSTTFEIPSKTQLRHTMYVVGEEVWLVAYTKKEYFMFKLKISSPKLSPLNPGITAEKFTINEVIPMDNQEVAITYFYGPKKKREFDVIVLSEKGKTIERSLLSSLDAAERQLIIDASVTRLGDGDYALTGTYNKKGKGMGNGIYFARFKDKKVGYLSNFDYSDFEHFYDYLSDKRKEKVTSKIEKKKGKGKDVTINTLSVSHKALVSSEGLVFVAEYYYPTYRTETVTTTTASGTTTTTRRVFDGYQYTHAMAIGIDDNGKKIYDLHIPLHTNYKPMVVKKFLRMSSDTMNQYFLHTSGRYVYSSVITDNNITNNEYEVLNKIPEGEKEKWSVSNGMYWYGPYFFIMETKKTKEKGLGGARKVTFYCSKVEVL